MAAVLLPAVALKQISGYQCCFLCSSSQGLHLIPVPPLYWGVAWAGVDVKTCVLPIQVFLHGAPWRLSRSLWRPWNMVLTRAVRSEALLQSFGRLQCDVLCSETILLSLCSRWQISKQSCSINQAAGLDKPCNCPTQCAEWLLSLCML